MIGVLTRLWPKSLAGRLTLFLVIALAIAQAGLTVVLSTQRDRTVEGLLHSQSLNQTVTLARLLEEYPASEAAHLTTAFGSRQACAWIRAAAPPTGTMTSSEQQLASVLGDMLHGTGAGTPVVAIETSSATGRGCNDSGSVAGLTGADATASQSVDTPANTDSRFAALAMDVPLSDGRWLSVRTRIDVPPEFDRITIISFLLSSLAVALVVLLVVRNQTRSLRTLADASERFGRGESVPILPSSGPSEVVAATHAFNTMQERLSEFIRDRMRLLASVSHDLRTPITTLRLKAEFIDDDAVRDDLVKTIDELATISEATLAFTRAEATSEETSIVDLSELVREVDEEFILADRPLTEPRLESVECACRPVALKRAIRNLIENALRYGGRAEVSVFRSDGHAVIQIDDEGPGIAPDRVAEAFQPFVRLEPSRSTETGGIGLGLAIAKGIAIAHGGSIELSNLPQHGLRATINLPVSAKGRA